MQEQAGDTRHDTGPAAVDDITQSVDRPFEALPHTWPGVRTTSLNWQPPHAKPRYLGQNGTLDTSMAADIAAHDEKSRNLIQTLDWLFSDPVSQAVLPDTYLCPDVGSAIWSAAQAAGFSGGLIRIHDIGLGSVFNGFPDALKRRSMAFGYTHDPSIETLAKAITHDMGGIRIGNVTDGMSSKWGNADLSIALLCNKPVETKWATVKDVFASEIEHLRERGVMVAIGNIRGAGMAALIEAAQAGSINVIAVINVANDLSGFNRESLRNNHLVVAVKDSRFRSGSPKSVAGVAPDDNVRRMTWVNGVAGPVVAAENSATGSNEIRVLTSPDVPAQVRALVARAKSRMDTLIGRITRSADSISTAIESSHKDGMYSVLNGVLMQSSGGLMEPCKKNKPATERCKALIELRDAMIAYVAIQKTDDLEEINRVMVEVNEIHDRFVSRFGAVNAKENMRAFSGDPYRPLLRATETPMSSEDDTIWVKSKLLLGRSVFPAEPLHADTVQHAVNASLAVCGSINLRYMSEIMQRDPREILIEGIEKSLIFIDPEREYPIAAAQYLSGDIRAKIDAASNHGRAYEGNVEALKACIPESVPFSDIDVKFGARWVPAMVFASFINEVIGSGSTVALTTDDHGRYQLASRLFSRPGYSTTRKGAHDLVNATLAMELVTVTSQSRVDKNATIAAREVQARIVADFQKWLKGKDALKPKIEELYNTIFNRFRQEDYASVLRDVDRLPNMSSVFALRDVQKSGIARVLCSTNPVLLAHDVGVGKTLELICSAMELRRIGKAKKPFIIVPTAQIVEQFESTIAMTYPEAYVIAETEEDKGIEARAAFLARIMASSPDIVVMTHSTFCMIRSPIDALHSELMKEPDRRAYAEIVKSLLAINNEERRSAEKKSRESIATEYDVLDIGCDWIMVDEAHYFKNLPQPISRGASLGGGDSKRSVKLLAAIRAIAEKRGDGLGVTFATGTPIANSMSEVWTMMFMLSPSSLERIRSKSMPEWVSNFAEKTQVLELAPDGKSFSLRTKFSRFTNVPELMSAFRVIADVVTSDMIDLPLPKADNIVVSVEATPHQKAFINMLASRADKGRNAVPIDPILMPFYSVDMIPSNDNMLAVTSDGRKAALDLRLISDKFREDHSLKIQACADRLFEEWRDTRPSRMTQLVFCDLGTHDGSSKLSVYGDLKDRLIDMGVPAHEIIFASDMATDQSRKELVRAIRSGKVRIAIGSTMKMGVGMNAQDRVSAIHELDAPWRPADVQQRVGRAVRQGNVHYELGVPVKVIRYVTKGTFDAYVWQMLEHKARFISAVLSSKCTSRSMEDADEKALTYAEVKAIATGNPLIIEKARTEAELARLGVMLRDHELSGDLARMKVASYREMLFNSRSEMENMTRVKSHAAELDALFDASGPLGSEDALNAIVKTVSDWLAANRGALFSQTILELPHWKLSAQGRDEATVYGTLKVNGRREMRVKIEHESGWIVSMVPRATLQASLGDLDRIVRKIDDAVDEVTARIRVLENKLDEIEQIRPAFMYAERMRELEASLREINLALGISESDLDPALA